MIRSMTGFGKSSIQLADKTFNIEVRSLNSQRGSDLSVRLPGKYRQLEYEWRNLATQTLQRGKIDISLRVEQNAGDSEVSFNKTLLISYYQSLKSVADEVGASTQDLFSALLRLPEVMGESQEEATDQEKEILLNAFRDALAELDLFRIREGKVIQAELLEKNKLIMQMRNELIALDHGRLQDVRLRINTHLSSLMESEKIDQNRFEQELIYYLEKLDISEELSRLHEHCTYLEEVCLSNEEQKGRKLNFIAQEIGREINTIGSKANHAGMQKLVVGMKDELEKIKEQTGNIL